jgi:hypothetical protein
MKMNVSLRFLRIKRTTPLERGRRWRAHRAPHAIINLAAPILLLFIVSHQFAGCQPPEQVQKQEKRTLTTDERYIVELYMKINEIEKNLQDNPGEAEKKRQELKREIDAERVRRILRELEDDPERWLAIYGRINELIERAE